MTNTFILSISKALLAGWLLSSSYVHPMRIDDKESLRGTVFRVSAFEQLPFVLSVKKGKNITYEGASVEVTEMVTDYYQMKTEYVAIDPDEFTRLGGGVAAANQLARKEVDFVNFPIVLNFQYSMLMDFTFPVWIENFILMQPFPDEESRLIAPIRPFTSIVWLLFLISVIVFIGFQGIMTMCTRPIRPAGNQTRSPPHRRARVFWSSVNQGIEYVFTIITSQGNYVPYASSLSMKVLIITWLLAMIVLINAYAGLLTAFLSVPKLKPTLDTFEEVVESSNGWRVTIELNSDLSFKFLNASSGPFKVIGDELRQDPDLLITDPFKVLTNVVQHKCVYPSPSSVVNFYIANDLKSAGKCRTTSGSKPLLYMTAFAFGYAKNSPYTELINKGLFPYLWQMGYFDYIGQKYFPVINQCRANVKPTGKTSSFKLIDFIGAFVLLGFGLGIASASFFIKLISARCFVKN